MIEAFFCSVKCEFASYICEKELFATIKMKSYLPHFRTQFVAAMSCCRAETLSTLTSCQRSKNLGMNLPPGLPCRFPQSPGSCDPCGNSFNMAEVLEVLVTCPVTIILNFYVLDKETKQKVQVHKEKNQRRMKMLVPRNRIKKLERITEN